MMGMTARNRALFLALIISAVPVLMAADITCAQEQFKYDSHGKRDPFVPLVTGAKETLIKLVDVRSIDEISLEGVATGAKGEAVAMLNGEMVRQKTRVGNVEVEKIDKKAITLLVSGVEYKLDLRKEE